MYYTLQEAAREIGIQVRTARDWLVKGKMKAEQDERSHRYRVSEEEVKRLRTEHDNKN